MNWTNRTTGRFALLLSLSILYGSSTATANDRLPDWVTISPKLASETPKGSTDSFPSEEKRQAWRSEGFGYADLLWRIDIHLERSGMIESRIEVVRHFVSESGISQFGNMELYADAWRDQLVIETGYSIAEGGAPLFVDPETIEVVSDDFPNVFSDTRRIILPVPGLHVGSNARVVGTRRFQSADFPLNWSWISTLGSLAPIDRFEIRVTRERGAPEIAWETNDPLVRCEESSTERLFCVRLDIQATKLDPNVDSYADIVPHIYIGVPETWAQLQARVRALVDESAGLTPTLRAKAKSLGISAAEPARDKLWKLLRFVADEIRYVSLSHGDSTVVPHPAALTLERRYGDCKDKVTLMVALAKVLDIDLVPVLTSSERKAPDAVLRPSAGYFNHMIACIDPDGRRPLCVDPTQAYSGFETHPLLAGAITLSLGAGTEAKLGELEAPEFGWILHVDRDLAMEPDASVRIRDVRKFQGPGAASIRTEILGLSWADRDAWIKRDYRDATGRTAVPTFAFRSLRDAAAPYEIESNLAIPGGYKKDSGEYYGYDPWLVYYARGMISVNQHYPYRLQGFRYTARETITQCCGEIMQFAPTLDFVSEFGSLRRRMRKVDGKLVIETVFELPSAIVPVDEIPRLQEFIMQASNESGLWFAWESGS